jgi:hypothetical protein
VDLVTRLHAVAWAAEFWTMDRFRGIHGQSDLRLFVFHEVSPPFFFELFIRGIAETMGDFIVPAGHLLVRFVRCRRMHRILRLGAVGRAAGLWSLNRFYGVSRKRDLGFFVFHEFHLLSFSFALS